MVFSIGTDKREGTLNLSRANNSQYSTEHTDNLATKYSIALGDVSPGESSVRASLVEGNTSRLGQLLSQQKQIETSKVQNDLIQEIALKSGGNPTEQDLEIVRGLSMQQMQSPEIGSILEEEYARKVTDTSAVLLNEETGVLDDAMAANPEQSLEIMDRVQNIATRNMIAANLFNEVQTKFDKENILIKGQAFLQQVVPFRSWQEMNTFVKGAPFISLIPGDSIEGQIAYLYTLPPNEMKAELERGVQSALQWGNYLDTLTFLEAVQSFSENDGMLNNVYAGLDVAGVVPTGLLAKGLGRVSRVVNGSTKSLVSSAKELNLGAKAVEATVKEALVDKTLPGFHIRNIVDAEKTVPSIFRPTEAFSSGTVRSVDGPALSRLTRAAEARAGTAMEILTDVNRVERLTPDVLEVAYKEAEQFLRENFTHQNHSVINVARNLAEDNPGNVYSVTVSLGQKNGNPFRSEQAAKTFAEFVQLKTDDFSIDNIGSGFIVNVNRNIDETSGGIRNLEIATNSKSPDTFDNKFLGMVYGADKKLSKEQTTARGVAVMSSEHMATLMEDFSLPFTKLTGGERKDLEKFLAVSRDYIDPKTQLRGISYHTVADFEDAFHARLGRMPSYAEVDAYQAFKQAYDLDWVIRDLDVFKQKASMGVEQLVMKFGDTDTTFEGKVLSGLPRGSKTPFTVGVVHNGQFVGRTPGSKYPTFRSNLMREADWDLIQAYIDDGFQVIQAYEGRLNLGDVFTNFVITRDVKRNRVGMMNLNYREGSRVVQKHPYYVKQGRVSVDNGVARYMGDAGAANARSLEEANTIAKHLDRVRTMIKNNDSGLMRYIKDHLPMHDADHVIKQFSDGTFDLNVPFRALKSGVRSIDNFDMVKALNNEGLGIQQFITSDEFDLSRQVMGKFLGERDAVNMSTYKVENGTVLKADTDPLLSPFDTLRLSMSDMINTHVLHDYRIKSAWDFTKEFGDLLDGTEADFLTNGLQFIFNPKYKTGIDAGRRLTAENVRKSIVSLFNHQTIVDRALDGYKEKLTSTLRSALGDSVGEWVGDKAIHTVSNGDKWLRAAAFHSKMGFFNVKQLFLQSSAVVNIVSIAPTHGVQGAKVFFPLRHAMFATNEKVLNRLASKQTVSGMPKEHFLELVGSYKRSGFGHVGNDVAYLDDLMPPKMVKGKVSTVLDWGATFFKEGERTARTMAYATAYSERKQALRGAAMSRRDEAWVLQRAKDLTGNMTRDSNAGWQKGYGAIATQFMGFQMRLMEQMIGTKLTGMEKARLFTGMSLMYGVPVASGMALGVFPVREWIKDWMAKEGVEYDNTLAEPFIDGFASSLLELASGMDLDVAGRYGPGGITTLYDLFKGDAELSDLLMGASGGILGDTIKDANPVLQGIWDTIDFNEKTNFPITTQDLIEPLRNISSVNNTIKLWEGVNLGRWMSQNENNLTEVSMEEAVVSSVFGLDPDRVTDTFNQLSAIKEIKDYQASVRSEMVTDYRRGLQSLRAEDYDNAKKYFSRVKAMGVKAGFTTKQMSSMYIDAADSEPMDESVWKSYETYVKSNTETK